jgi:hypothetical protein
MSKPTQKRRERHAKARREKQRVCREHAAPGKATTPKATGHKFLVEPGGIA